MSNPRINFSHNWNNKLLCIAHTTIRVRDDRKYHIGAVLEEWYNHEMIGTATIAEIKHFTMPKLTETMALIDTGYGREAATVIFKNMYKARGFNWDTQQFSFITLRCEAIRVHYLVPTHLKRVDKAAPLQPEPTIWLHQPETDMLKLAV